MSGYEAKAYLALIGSDRPMNGYEVAKHSGVPRSTVYETLGKLAARGAAFEVNSDSDTITYVALPSDALLRRVRDRVEQSLAGLAVELDSIIQPAQGPTSCHLGDTSNTIERAIDLVSTARHSVLIKAWPHELKPLEAAVLAARAQGVTVTVVLPGEDDLELGHDDHHVLTVVKDGVQVLIAGVDKDAMWGHYSDDPAVVHVASQAVLSELALQALTSEVGIETARQVLDVGFHPSLAPQRRSPARSSGLSTLARADRGR